MLEALCFTEQDMRQITAALPDMSTDEALKFAVDIGLKNRRKRGPQKVENVLNFNRRRSDFVNAHAMYEQDKKALDSENLTPNQYQVECKKLADKWRI